MLTIGIDMSKCTFHAALDDTTVRKFKNSLEGIDFFHKEIKTHFIPTDTTIGIESTGVYHLLLAVCMRKIGYIVKIINPLESHRFLVAQTLRRTKTDAVDALAIRKMRSERWIYIH
jgi:transposase